MQQSRRRKAAVAEERRRMKAVKKIERGIEEGRENRTKRVLMERGEWDRGFSIK